MVQVVVLHLIQQVAQLLLQGKVMPVVPTQVETAQVAAVELLLLVAVTAVGKMVAMAVTAAMLILIGHLLQQPE